MRIVRKSLSDQIYEILKRDILTGKIKFGEMLVNRDLQNRFDVSSTPVRDAILKLHTDGLIDSIERTGSKVIDFTLDFALEVNEVLMYIVQWGMISAFKKGDIDTISSETFQNIEFQREHLGTERYFDYDYKFHKTFVDHSKNSRLIKLFKEYNVLHEVLVRTFYTPQNTADKQGVSIQKHVDIANAFKNKDIDLATKLTEEHYNLAEELFKENLK